MYDTLILIHNEREESTRMIFYNYFLYKTNFKIVHVIIDNHLHKYEFKFKS